MTLERRRDRRAILRTGAVIRTATDTPVFAGVPAAAGSDAG
jgi:hypothetical protein